MDKVDEKILQMLQENARIPVKEIAKEVFLSSPAVSARIDRLSQSGLIKGYHMTIDREKLGYDAISSVAPFYFKYTFAELKQYYFDIVNEVALPMIVYHFPNFSGVSLTAANVGEFLQDDRFAGIKYTSSDYFMMEQIKSAFPDKVVFNGFDETFLAGISLGADGGIGSTYNFMADKFVKIKKLYAEGKMQEAKAVQQEANAIITVLCQIGVMQAEKEVLNQMGLDFGHCRRPFAPVTEEQKKLIAEKIIPYI